jgi:hypothetical protein
MLLSSETQDVLKKVFLDILHGKIISSIQDFILSSSIYRDTEMNLGSFKNLSMDFIKKDLNPIGFFQGHHSGILKKSKVSNIDSSSGLARFEEQAWSNESNCPYPFIN